MSDPDTLSLEVLFDHDPARLGGAGTVALEHDGALWIGTFAGDRILRVAESSGRRDGPREASSADTGGVNP